MVSLLFAIVFQGFSNVHYGWYLFSIGGSQMHCSVSEFLLELCLTYLTIQRPTCLKSYVETLQALGKHMCQRNGDTAKIDCRVLLAQT